MGQNVDCTKLVFFRVVLHGRKQTFRSTLILPAKIGPYLLELITPFQADPERTLVSRVRRLIRICLMIVRAMVLVSFARRLTRLLPSMGIFNLETPCTLATARRI